MLSIIRRVGLVAAVAMLVGLGSTAAAAGLPAEQAPSVLGWFEGHWIRLADDWGEAKACTSTDGLTAHCYRSEAEMDAAEDGALPTWQIGAAPMVDCASPSVRLYRSTGWVGGVLQLTARFTVLNLALYGFDNDTSSYRIGACSADFFDGNSGGTTYPGNTNAGASASSMLTSWDDRVSSVFIY